MCKHSGTMDQIILSQIADTLWSSLSGGAPGDLRDVHGDEVLPQHFTTIAARIGEVIGVTALSSWSPLHPHAAPQTSGHESDDPEAWISLGAAVPLLGTGVLDGGCANARAVLSVPIRREATIGGQEYSVVAGGVVLTSSLLFCFAASSTVSIHSPIPPLVTSLTLGRGIDLIGASMCIVAQINTEATLGFQVAPSQRSHSKDPGRACGVCGFCLLEAINRAMAGDPPSLSDYRWPLIYDPTIAQEKLARGSLMELCNTIHVLNEKNAEEVLLHYPSLVEWSKWFDGNLLDDIVEPAIEWARRASDAIHRYFPFVACLLGPA